MAMKFLNTVAVDTDVRYLDASSNNVGIGTTSPNANAKLTLSGAGMEVPTGYGVFNDTGGANSTGINFTAAGTNILTFFTGNAERMRIGSSGQLGIGGANYGTSGQVLTSGGSGAAPSWQSVSFTTNVITFNTTATANNVHTIR